MRGGKDNGKIAGPLFPRLHVNDTLKGGPKPPPRNRMALYEQLSIPSHGLSNAPDPTLPHLHVYRGKVTNTASSSQGVGKEKGAFSPFQRSVSSAHLTGRHSTCSSNGVLNNANGHSINKSMMISLSGHSNVAESFLPTIDCRRLQPSNISQYKWLPVQKDEKEFDTLTLVHPGPSLDSSSNQFALNKGTCCTDRSSLKLQTDAVSTLNISSAADQESHSIPCGEGPEMPPASDANDKGLSDLSGVGQSQDGIGIHVSGLSIQVSRSLNSQYNIVELGESTSVKGWSHVDMGAQIERLPGVNAPEQPKVLEMKDASVLENEICCNSPLSNVRHSSLDGVLNDNQHQKVDGDPRLLNAVRNGNQRSEENELSFPPASSHRNDHRPETPMEGCASRMLVSLDDVVATIGQKHFWKAREEIIKNWWVKYGLGLHHLEGDIHSNPPKIAWVYALQGLLSQQRQFSMQVFELHRIVKVQRLIAGSANLLQEKHLALDKEFNKPPLMKELLAKLVPKPTSSLSNLGNDVSKTRTTENPHEKAPPLPPFRDEIPVPPNLAPNLGAPGALPPSMDEKFGMWCLLPPGSHWLVPVMSPTEGLIYKPYSGASPPPGSFLATLDGSCGPSNVTTPGVDFPKLPFPIHPGATPFGPTYFSANGMPILSLSFSAPTAEQIVAKQDSNFLHVPYQSSYIIERDVGEALKSKDSENQESTGSTSRSRMLNYALPLFPTAPTA